MKNELQNHPLNGIKLDALLNELVDHYGWDILAAQIPINCFTSYPSIKSSLKFLRKTVWARQRLEAFYLYQYCQYPRPSDEQHELPPRERLIDLAGGRGEPVVLSVDDAEFFDDPASGPLFPSKRAVSATQSAAKGQRKTLGDSNSAGVPSGGLSKDRVEAEDRIVKSESTETFAQPSVEKPATSTREANEEEADSENRAQETSEKVAHNPWAKALGKLGESDAE